MEDYITTPGKPRIEGYVVVRSLLSHHQQRDCGGDAVFVECVGEWTINRSKQ